MASFLHPASPLDGIVGGMTSYCDAHSKLDPRACGVAFVVVGLIVIAGQKHCRQTLGQESEVPLILWRILDEHL